MPNLEILELVNGDDKTIATFAECCSKLYKVSLVSSGVTRAGLSSLFKCKIESLTFDRCGNIVDECLDDIAEQCPDLTNLSLLSCSGLSSQAVNKICAIKEKCLKLAAIIYKT